MSTLYFSDILRKSGIDPETVKLIRHSFSDENFRNCYDKNMIQAYTSVQKPGFSRGYEFWCVFIGGEHTTARFYACYRVRGSVPDTPDLKPDGFPVEAWFHGNLAYYDLEPVSELAEYKNRLVIEWGRGALAWHQKGTTEKAIAAIESKTERPFVGYENVILSYAALKEVVENTQDYRLWQDALRNVYAVYLIVDLKSGQQYVGSAYGTDGLLGRWREYMSTLHGNNKLMKELLNVQPAQFNHFQFSILQVLPKTKISDEVIHVEAIWKKKLGTLVHGLNAN